MKILIIADTEEKVLYDHFNRERFRDVDLIVSCGDLNVGYLDFVMTMVNVPMFYIRGNHDDELLTEPPLGAVCLEDKVVKFKGYCFAGLGGCLRYNNRAKSMFTESEMKWRCIKLASRAKIKGGVDILVTHAPVRGYGDLEDLPHRGFKCFDTFLTRFHPAYLFHGHVHKNYKRGIQTEYIHPSGTVIVNGCGYEIVNIPDRE